MLCNSQSISAHEMSTVAIMFVDKGEMPGGGHAVTERMLKVRRVQMELLRKLLEVCGRHGLHVWLDGGSLLGLCARKATYLGMMTLTL